MTNIESMDGNQVDPATVLGWLDLDADGALAPEDRPRLDAALEAEPALCAEREALEALHAGLAESRIAVRGDFAEQVMRTMPVAPWENRRTRWWLPLAMFLTLAVGSSLLLAGQSIGGGIGGTALAILDFFQTTALAGAGLVGVSVRGAGLAVEELLRASGVNLLAMSVFVVSLNLLFFFLLRSGRTATACEDVADDRS